MYVQIQQVMWEYLVVVDRKKNVEFFKNFMSNYCYLVIFNHIYYQIIKCFI